jgi:hypothetical protein
MMPLLFRAPANVRRFDFVITVQICVEIEHLRSLHAQVFNYLHMERGVRGVYGTIEEITELRFTTIRS